MRFLCFFLAAAAFHGVHSASIQTASNEEKTTSYDGLTELQKIDQMEFEAAQKAEEAQMNEGQDEEVKNASAVQEDSVEKHVEAEIDSTEPPVDVTEMTNLEETSQTVPAEEDVWGDTVDSCSLE